MIKPCTITIRGPLGSREIRALRYGEWATYRLPDKPSLWVLCLIPIGYALPLEWASFISVTAACRAMVAIQRLRNSWALVEQSDLTVQLRDRVRHICHHYGAVEGPVTMSIPDIDHPPALHGRPRINGYHLERKS